MTGVRRTHSAAIERIAIAAFAVVLSNVAFGAATVELHSIGPAEGFPGSFVVWARVAYGLSVDCSPPRACYAKSQWIHAYVHCRSGSLAMIQRISMDLNGDVVATATAEQVLFLRPRDEGGVAVFVRVCGFEPDDEEVR